MMAHHSRAKSAIIRNVIKHSDDFMGNYHDLEYEFIERTIALIDQYYASLDQLPFEKQYNYTLTINCLLGLIVMPKERALTYLPKLPINTEMMTSVGLNESKIGRHIPNLKILGYMHSRVG